MNRIGRRILVTGLAFCLAAPVLPGTMMVRATEPAATTEAAPSEEEINAAKEKLMELLDKYSGEKIKQLVSDAIKKINQKDDITTTWLDDLIADTEEQAKIWGAQTAPTTPPSTDSSSGNSSGSSSSGSSDSDEDDYIDDDMREDAYVELINYKDSLIARENPEQ